MTLVFARKLQARQRQPLERLRAQRQVVGLLQAQLRFQVG